MSYYIGYNSVAVFLNQTANPIRTTAGKLVDAHSDQLFKARAHFLVAQIIAKTAAYIQTVRLGIGEKLAFGRHRPHDQQPGAEALDNLSGVEGFRLDQKIGDFQLLV